MGKLAKKSSNKESKSPKKIETGQIDTICESGSYGTFPDMEEIDDRLQKAIADLCWARPTLVQEKFIPLALEGKDILARGRTGSGKTAAFAIPIIHRLLTSTHEIDNVSSSVRALILTPTKELCQQVSGHIQLLTTSCSREIRIVDLSSQADIQTQKSVLKDCPDIVIGTPARVLIHIRGGSLVIAGLQFLVIDEADLLFSFGFEDDTREIAKSLPKIYQCFLTSATLNDEVKSLKKLVLRNPLILKLEESQLPTPDQLIQYHIKCEEEDKFVLIYALIKLRLIRGKSIIFVCSVDRCYRLKLFLEQFGIPCCVLNSELPVNSRCHIVKQFNEGSFDFMVAADENLASGSQHRGSDRQPRRKRADKESGVSRGIDFHQVSNVINFDFPDSVESYIHRVGRTARGWNKGTALSFASENDTEKLNSVSEALSEQMGSDVFKPYQFRMEELDGFKYRARDVLRAVTSTAIREARLQEIKGEILNSRKLKSYFANNPRDLAVLKHDKTLHTVKQQQHLRDVPDYIVPPTLRGMNYGAPLRSKKRKQDKKRVGRGQLKFEKRKVDPLKSFECASDSD